MESNGAEQEVEERSSWDRASQLERTGSGGEMLARVPPYHFPPSSLPLLPPQIQAKWQTSLSWQVAAGFGTLEMASVAHCLAIPSQPCSLWIFSTV